MKRRHARLLPRLEIAPPREVLEWRAIAAPAIARPAELSPWEWVVFLLHKVAEIEHALMVQYLYALYSLKRRPDADWPDGAQADVRRWRRGLADVAKQEMAHLLTVQNLLRFVGAPLTLDREDFPFESLFYPFRFRLEPLSRDSLAKYIAAEMPAIEPDEELRAILERLEQPVNRVGAVLDEVQRVFADPGMLPDGDLNGETRELYQAPPETWFGSATMLVRSVSTRAEALQALEDIARQGEGGADGGAGSHFGFFLDLYRGFPEAGWRPAHAVAVNPTTAADPAPGTTQIRESVSLAWAQVANLLYRRVLLELRHALALPRGEEQEARDTMRAWLEEDMGALRTVGRFLAERPLKETGDARAAVPWEMPHTIDLPDRASDRRRLHLSILDALEELLAGVPDDPETDALVASLLQDSDARRAFLGARNRRAHEPTVNATLASNAPYLVAADGPTILDVRVPVSTLRIWVQAPRMAVTGLRLVTSLSLFEGYTAAALRLIAGALDVDARCGQAHDEAIEPRVRADRMGPWLDIDVGPMGMYLTDLVLTVRDGRTLAEVLDQSFAEFARQPAAEGYQAALHVVTNHAREWGHGQ